MQATGQIAPGKDMKTLKSWLDEYSESHLDPVNKTLHWICIPLIVFAIFCGLKALPWGDARINAATLVILGMLAYYARLSWQLAFGMLFVFAAMYAAVLALERATGAYLVWAAAAIFVAAWVGQFIGHHVEGARPSFFKDLQFLLIGPLWLLADVYRRMAIPMGPGANPRVG
jgi:uncharacterized membrane protein YGL010W